jgi:hypothetical protein
MPLASPLENAAVVAAAKVRSKISKPTHDRYSWLFISPDCKEDVKPVVESWISVRNLLFSLCLLMLMIARTKISLKMSPMRREYRLALSRGARLATTIR